MRDLCDANLSASLIDASGHVYFADEINNSIRVLTPVPSPLYQPHDLPRRRL